jgi:cation:H+ antiporter
MITGLELLAVILVILVAAEVFTNALEHLGERLELSEGVTGSLFAAVGTAMPETAVPVLAFLAGTSDAELNEQIGVGAIIGAPLMLATLSMTVTGAAVLRGRTLSGQIRPERGGLRRDLNFFLVVFALAGLGLFIPGASPSSGLWRALLAMVLLFSYFIYALLTVRASAALVAGGHATTAHHEMFLCRLGLPDRLGTVCAQLLAGVVLLIGGAKAFIGLIQQVSAGLQVSPLLLSLLIVPVATELPEAVNSVLWARRARDTLAIGNVTGAMVFQGSVLPALGLLLTPWHGNREVYAGIGATLVAAVWLRWALARGGLRVWHLLLNGLVYVAYVVAMLA